jgi:O-antigen/teichoic acid export membrane protein
MFTAVLTLFLVRALSPRDYGTFALAVAIVGLLAIPSDLGISWSAARFIAFHHGDRTAIARVISTALRLKLVVSGLVSIGLVAAAGTIAGAYHQPALAWPLRGLGIGLFGWSLFALYVIVFNAEGRTAVNTRIIGLESAMEAGASIVLVLAGAGATGAAFGWAAGYLFGAIVGTVTTVQMLGWSAIDVRRRSREMHRRVLSYAGAVAIVDVSWTVFAQIDVLVIGAFLTTDAVANFQAPMRLAVFLNYPSAAIATAVAPRLGRESHGGRGGEVFARACRVVILLQAMAVPLLLVWPSVIVEIFLGTSYHQAAGVLQALAPYVFMVGPATLASNAIDYLGEARRRIPSVLAAVLINVAVDLVLIPRVGVVGGAIGSDIAYAVLLPAYLALCLRIDGLYGLRLAPLLRSTARAAVAAAAMAGVMFAFGTVSMPAWEFAVGAACSLLAYAATLVVVGEVSRDELRTATTAARRLLIR